MHVYRPRARYDRRKRRRQPFPFSYKPTVPSFDGSTNYLSATNLNLGLPTNGTSFSFAFRFRPSNTKFVDPWILSIHANQKFRIFVGVYGHTLNEPKVETIATNFEGSIISRLRTLSLVPSTGAFYNVLCAADLTTSTAHLYLDDVDDLDTVVAPVDSIFWQGASDHTFAALGAGDSKFKGCMSDFWFSSQYIDFSVEANRRKFFDGNGKTVYKGVDGSAPTGTAPEVFFSGDLATWHTNDGTGGGFTLNGDPLAQCTNASVDIDFNVSAIGSKGADKLGTATAPIVIAQSSAAVKTAVASSTQSVVFNVSAVGTSVPSEILGTASAAVVFAQSSAAVKTAIALATAPVVVAISTAAVKTAVAQATSPVVFDISAVGIKAGAPIGTATAAVVFAQSSAAVKTAIATSAAAVAFTQTSAAVKTAIGSSAAPVVFAISSVATAVKSRTASAAVVFAQSSVGTRVVTGTSTAPIVFGQSSAAVKTVVGTSSAAVVFAQSSLAVKEAVATSLAPIVLAISAVGAKSGTFAKTAEAQLAINVSVQGALKWESAASIVGSWIEDAATSGSWVEDESTAGSWVEDESIL
jgi:hypothetical protein